MEQIIHYFDGGCTGLNEPEQSQNERHQELCLQAVSELKGRLKQGIKGHNFGLSDTSTENPVIGKMFGVMLIKTGSGQYAYLCAFSGKIAGTNQHPGFVPPLYDMLAENGFINQGMKDLKLLSEAVGALRSTLPDASPKVAELVGKRKKLSQALQQQLFDSYNLLNAAGEERNITMVFRDAAYKNPPAGAGECAAPKLYQYAYKNGLKPITLMEFWWGASPKSENWIHEKYYESCKEKCAPILAFMLGN